MKDQKFPSIYTVHWEMFWGILGFTLRYVLAFLEKRLNFSRKTLCSWFRYNSNCTIFYHSKPFSTWVWVVLGGGALLGSFWPILGFASLLLETGSLFSYEICTDILENTLMVSKLKNVIASKPMSGDHFAVSWLPYWVFCSISWKLLNIFS